MNEKRREWFCVFILKGCRYRYYCSFHINLILIVIHTFLYSSNTCTLVPEFFTTLFGKKVLYSEDKQSCLVKAKPTGAEEDSSEASFLTVLCGRHLNTEA